MTGKTRVKFVRVRKPADSRRTIKDKSVQKLQVTRLANVVIEAEPGSVRLQEACPVPCSKRHGVDSADARRTALVK